VHKERISHFGEDLPSQIKLQPSWSIPVMPGMHQSGSKAGWGGGSVPGEAELDNYRRSFDRVSLTSLLY